MTRRTWALLMQSMRVSARDIRVHAFRGLVVVIVVILIAFAQTSALRAGSPGRKTSTRAATR